MFRIIKKPVKFLGIILWYEKEIKYESFVEGIERIKREKFIQGHQNSMDKLMAETFENSF